MVISGKVLASKNDEYAVHIHDPSPQHKCYMPSWQRADNKDKSQKAKPKGFQPATAVVPLADVEYATQLNAQYVPYRCKPGKQCRHEALCYHLSTQPLTHRKQLKRAQ